MLYFILAALAIALVIGTFGFAFDERSVQVFQGALKYAQEHQDVVFRDFTTEERQNMEIGGTPPWTGRADGMLVVFGHNNDPEDTADWLLSGGVPVVNVAADFFDRRIPIVIPNAQQVAAAAAKHLAACGCQRFLHIGIKDRAEHSRMGDSFVEAARSMGLPVDRYDLSLSEVRLPEDKFVSKSHAGLLKLLRRPRRPVGVWVSANEYVTRAVASLCEARGLSIPHEVAPICTGNTLAAFGRRPTLASIDVDHESRGYRAAELVVGLVAGKRRPRKPIRLPIKRLIPRKSTGFPRKPEETLARALELMRSGACHGATINDIAKFLQINRTTLMRQFHQHLGRSPAEEIRRLRLSRARKLLSHTEFSISEIAAQVGFAEVAAFSSFFHKHMGQYPKEYRQSLKSSADQEIA